MKELITNNDQKIKMIVNYYGLRTNKLFLKFIDQKKYVMITKCYYYLFFITKNCLA